MQRHDANFDGKTQFQFGGIRFRKRLRAELQLAFAAPDESYHRLSAKDVIARNRVAPAPIAKSNRKR
jgi:hypothetical protein